MDQKSDTGHPRLINTLSPTHKIMLLRLRPNMIQVKAHLLASQTANHKMTLRRVAPPGTDPRTRSQIQMQPFLTKELVLLPGLLQRRLQLLQNLPGWEGKGDEIPLLKLACRTGELLSLKMPGCRPGKQMLSISATLVPNKQKNTALEWLQRRERLRQNVGWPRMHHDDPPAAMSRTSESAHMPSLHFTVATSSRTWMAPS